MNDLTLVPNAALPAYISGLEDPLSSRISGGGVSVPRISIRGRVWRLVVNGEEVGKNESLTLDAVIVDAAPKTARTYYAEKYAEGENKPPTCWSSDGEKPDAAVHAKQGATCSSCPMNIKGSGEGDRRACRISHRVAVAFADDPTGMLFQMIFPATSLLGEPNADGYQPLKSYAKFLAGKKVPMTAVVTQMKFDTDSTSPRVVFKAVDYVDEGVYRHLTARREAGETAELVEMSFTAQTDDEASSVVALPAQPVPAHLVPPTAAVPMPTAPVAAAPVPVQPAVVTAAPAPVKPVPQPTVIATPAQPTPSGDDRQARIAAALARFGKPKVA